MVTMGLVSLIFAAFMLYRRRDIKRLFAYSSIEHMGIIVFAFGMGGPLANFAGLLHMVMHSLTKSAIFYAVGTFRRSRALSGFPDPRPDGDPSGARLGAGGRRGRNRRTAAARHLHAISRREFDLCKAAVARDLAGVRAIAGLRRLMLRLTSVAFGEPRGSGPGRRLVYSDVCASRAGVGRRDLSSRPIGGLVPARGSAPWIGKN